MHTVGLALLAVGSASFTQAATAYYVDPDWQGGREGTPEAPWTRLDADQWRIINDALATDDVTVHFSAREADRDANEETTNAIGIDRLDDSAHRLTLDGMSLYNTDDRAPSWAQYVGESHFHISADYPIGTPKPYRKRNYVTVRGFDVLAGTGGRGGQGVHYWGGDHLVIEECRVTHAPNVAHGPGMIFGYAWKADGSPENGGCVDITYRNNTIHDVYGEGLYIGGSHNVDRAAHRDVLIEGNTIYNVGRYGGEGDAIDIKDGSTDVVIRGNTLYMDTQGAARDGIAMSSGGVIEGNFIRNFGRSGISLSTYWNAAACRAGTVVRNNAIAQTGGNPAYTWDFGIIISGSPEGDQYTGVDVHNNTIVRVVSNRDSGGAGLVVQKGATANVINNLIAGCAGWQLSADDACLLEHDYNLLSSSEDGAVLARAGRLNVSATDLTEFEAHSVAADPGFPVDGASSPADLVPDPGSPAVGAAMILAAFGSDLLRRPRGDSWDIGALQSQ